MKNSFWPIPWDSEQLKRFWEWQSQNMSDNYFTMKTSRSLIEVLSGRVRLKNSFVIDYGSGPGFFTEKLLSYGSKVIAIDQSRASLDRLIKKFPTLEGVFTIDESAAVADSSADVVVLIETIEHLNEAARIKVLEEIKRLLKKGGILFITCPNSEDLSKSMVCCPNCGGVFHKVQHLVSYDAQSLERTLLAEGYADVHVGTTSFLSTGFSRRRKEFLAKLFNRKLPHLYAFARKSS